MTQKNDQPDAPSPAEQYLAWRVTELLMKLYPGHPWACHVGSGVITVRNMLLSGEYGYYIHLNKVQTDDDFKRKVTRAGGEILERFSLGRGRMAEQEVMNMKRDFARRPVFDAN